MAAVGQGISGGGGVTLTMPGEANLFAEIHLGHLAGNFKWLQQRVGKAVGVMAVVKDDAYGHGLLPCAQALQRAGAAAFGVVTLGEALTLRQGGISQPILLLAGGDASDAKVLVEQKLTVAITSVAQAQKFASAGRSVPAHLKVSAHLKIDTGMNRLGIRWDEVDRASLRNLGEIDGLDFAGIFSHLANADHRQDPFAFTQGERFGQVAAMAEEVWGRRLVKHLANSDGLMRDPKLHFDWVRPGIALYGYNKTAATAIKPVMALKCKVGAVKRVLPQESVGYDRAWTATQSSSIAVLPVGYADGFGRGYSGAEICFFEAGTECGRGVVVGRVCMDMLMVDLGGQSRVEPGNIATLFGGEKGSSAFDLARLAATTHYQVLTAIHPRVPRVYLGGLGGAEGKPWDPLESTCRHASLSIL